MKKVILDVDTGIDDALAISYAVAQPDVELLGITTSYGMAPVEYTCRNTKHILNVLNKDVPVYGGAATPRKRTRVYNGRIHGKDGLGNTLGAVNENDKCKLDAVDFIIESTKKYNHDLTIITTGPLTNLARAINCAPEVMHSVGRIVTMGGAVATPGNASKFAEANILIDPESADFVFKSKLPITLVGLDVTRKTLLTQDDVEKWKQFRTSSADFFVDFTQFYLNAYKKIHPYLKGCALHDPLAVGVAIYPEIVHTVPMNLEVDLSEEALGRTVENLNIELNEKPNVDVCFQVDSKTFMEDFFTKVDYLLSIKSSERV
ncbi:nucleoside hydrolase [Oceanobacillus neutriphilus]|uniref:Ribosylpyrimidine nucleosidase n=1 Tax=Oceanobacillus neutriphilus TaxID=531815 RepID=A0ABQ2NNA2_9BACI|nr:nucleoside hydrolase [Oceanobacillus neutriphilus]GGP07697.1 ribosylpyrimidine nucleosidase [Oceanobacillus neutriphilus]